MKEMVSKFGFGVMFDGDSTESLAQKISYVVSSYDKFLNESDLARNLAKSHLAQNNYVFELTKIYLGVIGDE